jgi:hypothetical protein
MWDILMDLQIGSLGRQMEMGLFILVKIKTEAGTLHFK